MTVKISTFQTKLISHVLIAFFMVPRVLQSNNDPINWENGYRTAQWEHFLLTWEDSNTFLWLRLLFSSFLYYHWVICGSVFLKEDETMIDE